jgi:mannose-6-phosphate isomerase-like protein (cupin superfamily)
MHKDVAQPWIKSHVIRFDELKPLAASPADVILTQYQRQRFSVIGRPDEREPGSPGSLINAKVNFGYIRCAGGKGNCSHKHPNWEIFIPMSGRWRLTLEGGVLDEGSHVLELGPWDVIVIPGDTFHEALNISDADACMMSLNPGNEAAAYTVHPHIIEAIRRFSPEAASAAEKALDIATDT